jgi:aryl-alcohol dehydrogenase-like predicted oxidoreductase
MQYINLGRTGLKVSRICLGTMTYGTPAWRDWVLDEEASRPFIRRALDLGINFFDTADVYSNGASMADRRSTICCRLSPIVYHQGMACYQTQSGLAVARGL